MWAVRGLISSIQSGGGVMLRGRVSVTPQLLFVQCTVGLMCLYCLDYYIGGERGLSPFKDMSYPSHESKSHGESSESLTHSGNITTIEEVPVGASNASVRSAHEGDTLTHRAAKTFLGGYAIFYMVMVMGMFLFMCAVMCQKLSQRIRPASMGAGSNAIVRMLHNLVRTRYMGSAAERMRFRENVRLMRREITPEDYETLLALDAAEGFTAPRMGVSQTLIDRCPVMKLTQAHINNMSGGGTKVKEDDHLALAADEEGDGSTRNPLRPVDDEYACTVCLDEYREGDEIRTLPCMHQYHMACIDPWLLENGDCPECRRRIDDDDYAGV